MAPRTRAKRPRNKASTLHPSTEADSDGVRPLSNGDNLNGNHESKSINRAADDLQNEQMEAPAPQLYAMVLGELMPVPQTYDPDTYDPDGRMPWTPEPEPYSPETYAAWGRKHFGDDWYQLRKTMLKERNIYLKFDGIYKERQRALRIMEHKIEGRPFKPGLIVSVLDAGWMRLWARLSKDLGISSNPASPTPSKDNDDSDTDLSGYNTYPPTPESREPTPIPEDPWERLEYNRRRFNWGEEEYHYEKIFRKEALIDGARAKRENEDGDRQAREKREAMESFRYSDPMRYDIEKLHFQAHIDLPKEGWTREQIDAEYEADVALNEWRQRNPVPRGSGELGAAVTPEERVASDVWYQKLDAAKIRFFGELPPEGTGPFGFPDTQEDRDAMEIWRKNIHARVSRRHERKPKAGAISDASATGEGSKPRVSSPRQTKGVLHQTRSGRITKNAPTQAEASPRDRRRRPSEPDMLEELGDSTRTVPQRCNMQRKTYKKERASRRLAGELPEYGMLLGKGKAEPLYRASPRQPSNTRQTSGSSRRSSKPSKKPAAPKSVKPRGVLKPGQARTGRPKRLANGAKG